MARQELTAAIWPGVPVSSSALKVCIREIRQALRDEVAAPRFIRTAGRQGYWFIAPVKCGSV